MENTATSSGYPKDPQKLKEACDRYEALLTSIGQPTFFRTDFFDIDDLKKIIDLSQSEHVRVYYGVDENNRHFLFMAPTQPNGHARDDDDTTATICCCQSPPCPPEETDRYVDI